jgi:FtsP/CotA-like multicopper oxidase with cupredoxin domain
MRNMKSSFGRILCGSALALVSMLATTVQGAVPGITGATTAGNSAFDLSAAPGYVSQPDGASIYVWGYGCNTQPAGSAPAAVPLPSTGCPGMQLPGPTLIVHQGDTVTVKLTNNLPAAAGNTSILFPGFHVTTSGGAAGVLTADATHGTPVTYSFIADTAGTHSYYSGTQGDLQVEMGLYGALIVLPGSGNNLPATYTAPGSGLPNTCFAVNNKLASLDPNPDYRLAAAAYDHPSACYEREYMFQFSEMDPAIHKQALEQSGLACSQSTGCMSVATEPYHAAYFLINGRSFPDDADPNYSALYPNQPYNGNPHMHPGELVLVRVIGQGRLQHPLHEHANHVRLLARDGNMLVTSTNKLAGPLLFTTTTTPGQTLDGIFQYTGKGLNWDMYAHNAASAVAGSGPEGGGFAPCIADKNGYYTTGSGAPANAPNYYEWCADHKKPLESKPFGNVGSGGPVTLPDPTIVADGAWYSGSPYLGPDATARAVGPTPIPPFGTIANDPGSEAGFAYMWHSHNEREITTNNIFPGGMMMMMLVDPWVSPIDETK